MNTLGLNTVDYDFLRAFAASIEEASKEARERDVIYIMMSHELVAEVVETFRDIASRMLK